MSPALADRSTPAQLEQAPGSPSAEPSSAPAAADERTCANCGAPLHPAQDWCLQCGAGAPGSLRAAGSGWRSAGAVIGAAAILALGAAAAGYAALTRKAATPPVVRSAVAQSPAPAPVTPSTGAAPPAPRTLGAKPPPLGAPAKTPPSVPLAAPEPKPAAPSVPPATGTVSAPAPRSTAPTTSAPASGESGGSPPEAGESQAEPLLLDTNAASTYDPNGYPASNFGDPSLAIDGDSTTRWTAQLDPAIAPKVAAGLAIDLRSPTRLSAVVLVTSTPGITVQIYGAAGKTLPAAIGDPAWTRLTAAVVAKKRQVKLPLRDSQRGFRFITLWITRAPASAVGTPQAPGHVAVNEVELLPAS